MICQQREYGRGFDRPRPHSSCGGGGRSEAWDWAPWGENGVQREVSRVWSDFSVRHLKPKYSQKQVQMFSNLCCTEHWDSVIDSECVILGPSRLWQSRHHSFEQILEQ